MVFCYTLKTSYHTALHPSLLLSLTLLNTHLTSLTLHTAIYGLGPLLTSFTSLMHLSFRILTPNLTEYATLLPTINPPALETLRVAIGSQHWALVDAFLRALAELVRGMTEKGAMEVEIPVWKEALEGQPAGKAFLELCAERGVAVVFV